MTPRAGLITGIVALLAISAGGVSGQATRPLPVPTLLERTFTAGSGGSDETVQRVGDVLQIALPASGLAATLIAKDGEGTGQWAVSTALTAVTVWLMKPLAGKRRPGDDRRTAFPSGHAASAFAGASFLGRRYGAAAGIPAYALAGFVGVSRIASDQHFADDVLAGASIAQLSTWLLVTPRSAGPNDADRDRRWEYAFSLGPSSRRTNTVAAPGDGSRVDINRLVGSDDPSWTALAALRFRPAAAHEVSVEIRPFEARNTGMLNGDVTFGGREFTASETTQSLYSNFTGRAAYRLPPTDIGPLIAAIGLGIDVRGVSVELSQEEAARVTDVRVVPVAQWDLGARLGSRFDVRADATWSSWLGDRLVDFRATAGVRTGSRWELRFGYNRFERRVDTSDLHNDLAYDLWFGSASYSW